MVLLRVGKGGVRMGSKVGNEQRVSRKEGNGIWGKESETFNGEKKEDTEIQERVTRDRKTEFS